MEVLFGWGVGGSGEVVIEGVGAMVVRVSGESVGGCEDAGRGRDDVLGGCCGLSGRLVDAAIGCSHAGSGREDIVDESGDIAVG